MATSRRTWIYTTLTDVTPTLAQLVTRADLAAAFAELRAEMQALRGELRAEIQAARADSVKWLLMPLLLGQAALIAALVHLL